MDNTIDSQIRIALFQWLSERSARNGGVFPRKELEKGFEFQGKVITLVGPSGIWFPKDWSMPISITTAFNGPYPDKFENEILTYRYMNKDPELRPNRGMREAFRTRTPLVYFRAYEKNKYVALWPLYIISDNPSTLSVTATVAASPNIAYEVSEGSETEIEREYAQVTINQRLHQPAFRERVLAAYSEQCTLCGLKHSELLDAAHILPDKDPDGKPEVPNGLSLCKIHHASYDQKIIGISPDYQIKVREDILEEVDGPMLKYGLQSLEGKTLILPKKKLDCPDKGKLEVRYKNFLDYAV